MELFNWHTGFEDRARVKWRYCHVGTIFETMCGKAPGQQLLHIRSTETLKRLLINKLLLGSYWIMASLLNLPYKAYGDTDVTLGHTNNLNMTSSSEWIWLSISWRFGGSNPEILQTAFF